MTSELQGLLDREAIRTVIFRLCRGMDRADYELFRSCYHDDAWDDHGYYKGPIEDFKPASIFRQPHIKSLMHHIGNVLIDVQGDVAWSECYYLGYQRIVQDETEKDVLFGGRYFDRFERRGGEWKIAHRLAIFDWNRIDAVGESMAIAGAVAGSASREDPTYTRTLGKS